MKTPLSIKNPLKKKYKHLQGAFAYPINKYTSKIAKSQINKERNIS